MTALPGERTLTSVEQGAHPPATVGRGAHWPLVGVELLQCRTGNGAPDSKSALWSAPFLKRGIIQSLLW